MINIAGETLGFRCFVFSSKLTLLMPALSLLYGPPCFAAELHSIENAPLPSRLNVGTHSFGGRLEPRWIFGAETLDQ